jgi:hypothetical protein
MRAAITALSWELVARYRWVSVLAVVWLSLGCTLGLLLSAFGVNYSVGVALAMSLSGPLMMVLGGLSHGWDTHLENAGSCFPPRLLTLPVSTGILVGPPLLLGTAVVSLSWLLAAACMLRPFGMADVPLWWPAFCGAAVLAWLQALTWFPFPLPWVRPICVSAFLLALFYSTLLLIHAEIDERIIAALFVILLFSGYALALSGVRRARRGTGAREPFQLGPVEVQIGRQVSGPFSSPLRAQLWLDWKVHGWVFLFIAAMCLIVSLPSMYFADKVLQQRVVHLFPWLDHATATISNSWLVMGYLLVSALMIAACAGPEIGKAGMRVADHVCPPYLATRPISVTDMVKSKLIVGACGVAFTWAVLFVAGVCWAAWMGRIGEMTDRLVALTGSGWVALGVFLGGQLALLAVSWSWLVSGLWLGAWGRPQATGVIVGFGVLALIGFSWLLAASREFGWQILDAVIVICLVGKFVAICWVIRKLRSERVMTARSLTLVVVAWSVFVLLIGRSCLEWFFVFVPAGAIGSNLTPGEGHGWLWLGISARVAGITLLMLPLARPLAAPLALARNRTR